MTNDGVTIRAAVPGDEAALAAMVREYWAFEGIDAFDDARVRGVLATLLSTPALGLAWIAMAGGEPVGYLVACFVLSVEHGGVMAVIDECFVCDAKRGDGTGSRLLDTALAALTETGCVRVSLEVGRGNARARSFYRRHGFVARDRYDLLDRPLPD